MDLSILEKVPYFLDAFTKWTVELPESPMLVDDQYYKGWTRARVDRASARVYAYLKEQGKEVIFDAEHFYDGYKNNPVYALEVLACAVEGGADVLALCDTNGGCLPDEIAEITSAVTNAFPGVRVGIHCHNDSGCAVANSMSAVKSGAVQVQGTFVGYGERCGNADLSTIIANLALKCGYDVGVDLTQLRLTARKIAEISNVRLAHNHPYVGKSAFGHKAGMHIDGVQKCSHSFEHVSPEAVGNERRFLMSEVAGRGTVLPKIQKSPKSSKEEKTSAIITKPPRQASSCLLKNSSASIALTSTLLCTRCLTTSPPPTASSSQTL